MQENGRSHQPRWPDEPRRGDPLGPRLLPMGSRMQIVGHEERPELNGLVAVPIDWDAKTERALSTSSQSRRMDRGTTSRCGRAMLRHSARWSRSPRPLPMQPLRPRTLHPPLPLLTLLSRRRSTRAHPLLLRGGPRSDRNVATTYTRREARAAAESRGLTWRTLPRLPFAGARKPMRRPHATRDARRPPWQEASAGEAQGSGTHGAQAASGRPRSECLAGRQEGAHAHLLI